MDSIAPTRRQFWGQNAALVASAAVNNGRPSFLTGIRTARCAGTSLAAMLREAELLDSGIEVVFVGADTGEEHVRDIKVPASFASSMGAAW